MARRFKFNADGEEEVDSRDSRQIFPPLNANHLVNTLKAHIVRTYELDSANNPIEFPEPWRNLKELPSSEEINPLHIVADSTRGNGDNDFFTSSPCSSALPYNRIDRPWDNKTQYIGTHYQLIREDGISCLRSAVKVFKDNPGMHDSQDACVYTNVHIIGYTLSNLGPAARVEFSFERAEKRIRWDLSTRLKGGTIVAITPQKDCFRTVCKIAVVAARPLSGLERNPPQVDLFWAAPEDDAEFDPLEPYTMIEARSGYFEFNRHMLVAMQKLMTESFPMGEHLMNAVNVAEPPTYIKDHPVTNLRALINPEVDAETGDIILSSFDFLENVDILSSNWPKIPNSTLDRSQMQALERMLTKKIAIVQGPPGTGKTFVSVSALRVMLDNLAPGDPPLIVAAQTNHALDQLLTHILPFEKNFVRLGGRTSKENEDIVNRTLYNIRVNSGNSRKAPGFQRPADNYRSTGRALDFVKSKLMSALALATGNGITHPQIWYERGLITKEQVESLSDDEWASAPDPHLPEGPVAQWLGREQIVRGPVGCPPINLGFFEETDIEFEQLDELETEANRKDDDDDDALMGTWVPLVEEVTGKPSPGFRDEKIQRLLAKKQNLWEIPIGLRGEVYRYLQRQLKKDALVDIRVLFKEYMKKVENFKMAKWENDANMMAQLGIKMIGCTTTGLSKYRGLLAAMSPRTLLIEEAAETLEGTVLAAMFESLEHLVLVGDHKQLRAQCSLKYLENEPFSLAISMFERLVNRGVDYTMLNEQRRMIPEIRELLSQKGFYEELKDHDSVLDPQNRKPVPGMGGMNSLMFHHTWPESRDDAASRYNIDEADMIVGFFRYLALNGVHYSKITVLTYYNGQRNAILRLLKRSPDLQSSTYFKVFTVDSYQGEENDIILLSLVRSNDYNRIGFLDSRNRAVVALSRARCGLYVFGNVFNLVDHSYESKELWGAIFAKLVPGNRVVQGLPLICTNHGRKTEIREPGDWDSYGLTGGCDIKCTGSLPCDHKCPHKCHPFSHDDVLCREPCTKNLPCGHKCERQCWEPCHCVCDALGGNWKYGSENVNTYLVAEGIAVVPGVTVAQAKAYQQWKKWNAAEADAAADLHRLSLKSNSPNRATAVNYVDTHRHVALEGGVRMPLAATQRMIFTPTTENQSIVGDISLQPVPHRPMKPSSGLVLDKGTPPASTRGPSPELMTNSAIGQLNGPTPASSSRGQSPQPGFDEAMTRISSSMRGSFLDDDDDDDDDDEHLFVGIDGYNQDISVFEEQSGSFALMSHNATSANTSTGVDDEELLIDFE